MADIFNMADTWNAGGTTFTAIKMNVTDTASAAASMLMDLQVGGASRFRVRKDGNVQLAGSLGWAGGNPDTGATPGLFTSGISLGTTQNISWGDVDLRREAANTLALYRSTNAQRVNVYETRTDASNYSRMAFAAGSASHRILAEAAGTGTLRPIAIDAFSKAGAAVAGDIPAGTWALVRDTSGGTTKLIYNNAGTLQSVDLS